LLVPVVGRLVRRRYDRTVQAVLKTGRLAHMLPASYTKADDIWGQALDKLLTAMERLSSIEHMHHVVAHSMGNRIALDALKTSPFPAASVSFVAPDVPTSTFVSHMSLIKSRPG